MKKDEKQPYWKTLVQHMGECNQLSLAEWYFLALQSEKAAKILPRK